MPLTSQHLYTLSIQHVVHDIKHQLQSNPIFAISFIHLKKTVICHPQVFFSSPQNGTQRKKIHQSIGRHLPRWSRFWPCRFEQLPTFRKTVANYQLKKGICQRLILWLLRLIFGKVDICCTWFFDVFFRPQKGEEERKILRCFFLRVQKKSSNRICLLLKVLLSQSGR